MTEKQALLVGQNKLQVQHYNGASIQEQLFSSDIDTASSVGVFKSRLLLRQPSKDFYHEGIPIWRAALLVVNSALGAGILNFPRAYAECGGIVTAIIIQMVGLC